ncbi:MOSC domain-containing protein [Mariannaea sp. PMI_226]|nr:MOSC domain-containing protein [Mariannaea sp. PMI_226]
MKITELWVYPIKGIRGVQLDSAELCPQGIQHDRRFMLCKVEESGHLSKMQLARYPECSLFAQEIVGDSIRVRYLIPEQPLVPSAPEQRKVLEVPLEPDIKVLDTADVNLHQSLVAAYRMGETYDTWFSACFGFDVALIYIGDGKRPVLGSFSPKSQPAPKSWFASMASHVMGGQADDEEDWLTFTDCAPFLVTTEKSLENVSARLAGSELGMDAFRPNVVVDGEIEWDEDFWRELSIKGEYKLTLTKNCNRCTSLNVDYDTGRTAEGERGTVLKKLMSDRRVDAGAKYSPVFGRYGFFTGGSNKDNRVSVGDDVKVTERTTKRDIWDWPLTDPRAARYYQIVS